MPSREWIEVLGDVAGFCTTFAFVPQLVKIHKQGGATYPMARCLSIFLACCSGLGTAS